MNIIQMKLREYEEMKIKGDFFIPTLLDRNFKNLFVTSDQHFFHNNIIKYHNRPFDTTSEMNKHIINCYNERVTNNDLCIHLGDLMYCYGSNFEDLKIIFKELNGRKVLVRGNHDTLPIEKYYELGFELVSDILFFEDKLFCHYPFEDPNKFSVIEKKFNNQLHNYKTLYYGHIHSREAISRRIEMVNCCVDYEINNFYPVLVYRSSEDDLSVW